MRVPGVVFRLLAALSIALTIGACALPIPSAAQDAAAPPEFVLLPVDQAGPYFDLTMEPGETAALAVALGNAGSDTADAITYVADAFTLVNGGFGVMDAADPRTGATTWIDYPSARLDLAPGELVERPIIVTVPAETRPGQYIAGLVVRTAEPIAVGDSAMFQQIILKSIAVFITVPGEVNPKLKIGAATLRQGDGGATLVIDIRNPGNVLLKPAGTVTVTDEAGEEIVAAPVEMGSVYAGTETTLEITIPTNLPAGTYTARVRLADEATGAKATARALPVVAEIAAAAPPVSVAALTVVPAGDPAAGDLQFVNVGVRLANTGAPIAGVIVTLHVTRDGEAVEDFPLAASLALPLGTTEVNQRYLPLDGWQAGDYGFAVTVESVDARTGQTSLLATAESAALTIS